MTVLDDPTGALIEALAKAEQDMKLAQDLASRASDAAYHAETAYHTVRADLRRHIDAQVGEAIKKAQQALGVIG